MGVLPPLREVWLDTNGTLLTSNLTIKERALEVYTKRLKGNKIGTHLEDHEKSVNKLWTGFSKGWQGCSETFPEGNPVHAL